MTAPDWRDAPEDVAPTVLILDGFLTSPPFYTRMRWRLLDRGAAAVVVAPVWLPHWLAAMGRGIGPVLGGSRRALERAVQVSATMPASRGAPLLVVGHSAGGMTARVLAAGPLSGGGASAAASIGAVVTLGTPHQIDAKAPIGRRLAAATDGVGPVAPGAGGAPTTGYLAVTSRFVLGRPNGTVRERAAYRWYQSILPDPDPHPAAIEGDGLVPCRAAGLDGAETIVLDGIVHGQFGRGPWYGSAQAMEVWWPRALEVWREALRARLRAV